MDDVEQTKKIVPLIACEISFGQNVCGLNESCQTTNPELGMVEGVARKASEKWPRQSGAPKQGQPPVHSQPKVRPPDVKVSVPAIDRQVGSRDRSRRGTRRDGALVEGGVEESPSTSADPPV